MIDPATFDAARADLADQAPRPLAEIEKEALATRPGMRIIPTATARLRVRFQERAGAPTLVVFPDGPNVIEHYDRVFADLADELSIAVIEIPGFGFSYATDPQALTFSGCVQACAEVLRILDLPAPIYAGACIQAYVAIALAAARPDKTLGVIAAQATDVASERRWIGEAVDPSGLLRRPFAGQASWSRPANREKHAVDHWYPAAAAPGRDVSHWQETARRALRAGCSNALATVCQTWLVAPDDKVPVFDGRAIVMFGTADRTHAASRTDPAGLLAYLPSAQLRLLPQAGHFPDLEEPDAFMQAVRDLAGAG